MDPQSIDSLGSKSLDSTLPYCYQSLAKSDIRLLVLLPGQDTDPVRCRLDHAALLARPKYETISYAWGDPNQKSTIECDGKTIKLTKNLHSALRHLRYETAERVLWADAVCINQEDLLERSVQVLLMGEIYASSQQVAVWLGDETEVHSESIEHLEKLNAFFLENEEGYLTDPERWKVNPNGGSSNFIALLEKEKEWKLPLAALARSPWFVRRWVVQEVARSPAAIVVLGKKQISWITMAEVVWSLHKTGLLQGFGLMEDAWSILDGFQSIVLIELVRRDVLNTNGSKLLELMISTRRYKCLDQRDVIYSQLGVINDLDTYNEEAPPNSNLETQELYRKLALQPDYSSSAEDIYHRFVLANLVKKKSLLPLSATYIPPENPTLSLLSWVPDFSNLSSANSHMYLRNESALPYKASMGSELQVRFSNDYKTLHIMGRVIDVIEGVSLAQENVSLSAEMEEQSRAEDWTAETITNEKLKLWFDSCFRLLNPSTESGEDRIFGITPVQFEEFSRTLVCNLTASGSAAPENFSTMVREFLDVMEDPVAAVRKHVRDGDASKLIDRLLLVEGAVSLKATGWCFAITKEGRMGRTLSSARKGDNVVLFWGGEVPYLLRKREEGGWMFISSCYLFGMMDGEGMVLEGAVDEEFVIT